MNYNDVLRRLRFALSLTDAVVIDMFARSGHVVTPETLAAFLMKEGQAGFIACPGDWLEGFLDTLIVDRRGPRTAAPAAAADEAEAPPTELTHNEILKKVRIALDLKEDDVVAAIERGDGKVTRPHLRALFRNPGHKNYRACDEELLHAFLNGLTRSMRNKRE